ncbi:uncharacterized protein SOCE26_047980 [Sorangium cellulosum]|uniref:Uncharacterized protein n=1 Tax=Sorangium cellulosum TaxID=56 RepID=A0A2L0EVL8_SORCE|nr:hypothetical protein [Sorangium cellulosum]AUX43350.1 uncharacterized protein SOCE26_047980 [Sorangium cellulosum]
MTSKGSDGLGLCCINVGVTFARGALGAGIASGADGGDIEPAAVGLLFGGCLGLLTANIVDIAVFAYEEHEAECYDDIRLRLAPQVGFAPGGATFGLARTF